MSDYGFREYQTLRTRVLAAATHTEIANVSSRITKFVQDEDVNPVYADTLVSLLMERGYWVLATLDGESPTHDCMVTNLVTRNIRVTTMAWRSTMDRLNNNSL